MRIIAGVAKGRTLSGVADSTRPTSDRAREALFSTLVSEFGDFDGIKFLDLFAGTGAVGLEALSRGASQVHCVERDDAAIRIINENSERVSAASPSGTFHLYSMTAERFVGEKRGNKYHIVYIDPPYDYSNEEVSKLLQGLIDNEHLDPIALIAVERDGKTRPFEWPAGLVQQREKEYGAARIYYGGVA